MTSAADFLRGAAIVAGRDLRSNARGLKVWIISGLTLLLVLIAAFGIAAVVPQAPPLTAQYHVWVRDYWPTANNTTAGLEVWVSDYLGNPHSGFPVSLGEHQVNPGNITFVEKEQLTTNATGWVLFSDLGHGWWPIQVAVGALKPPPQVFYIGDTRPTYNLTVDFQQFEIIGDQANRDLGVQARWVNGTPAVGATVLMNGTAIGTTDANGFFYDRLENGDWNVTVQTGSYWQEDQIKVTPSPLAILPLLQGPDALLLFLGVELMNLFAPIIAIAMSYDAVAKERMQGSLELLLARPASRTGIAVGKFLGSFLSVGLPMLGVLLGALVGVAAVSGKWPDGIFAAAFVVGALGLIAAYVLIMQIFSTLAKSPGTAILSALVVWIVFNIAWSLVFLVVETVFHIEGGTPAAFALSAATSLFNPNLVYTLFVATFMPASLVGLFGTTGGGDLPNWVGPVAMLVWIAVLLVIAVIVFRKRIV